MVNQVVDDVVSETGRGPRRARTARVLGSIALATIIPLFFSILVMSVPWKSAAAETTVERVGQVVFLLAVSSGVILGTSSVCLDRRCGIGWAGLALNLLLAAGALVLGMLIYRGTPIGH